MQQTFVPRTSGVYSGDALVLWSNGEVRELYAKIEQLRAALRAGIGTHGEICRLGEECQFIRDARAALGSDKAQ